MRRWFGFLSMAALIAGVGNVAMGCGGSTAAHPKPDAASAGGGALGNGGLLGSGGASPVAGATGAGRTKTGGTAAPGTGGRGGAVGGGGAATGGRSGSGGRVGSGGYPIAGVIGTGGGFLGGAGGTHTGGAGGRTTAMDASVDGEKDGPGLDGDAGVVYSGCSYIGGIERAVVAKFDARAGVCVTLVLESPHRAPDAGYGMSISPYWGVAEIVLWSSPADGCATLYPPPDSGRGPFASSGSVIVDRAAGTIDIDAVFDFRTADAGATQSVEMKAQGVDFMHNC